MVAIHFRDSDVGLIPLGAESFSDFLTDYCRKTLHIADSDLFSPCKMSKIRSPRSAHLLH